MKKIISPLLALGVYITPVSGLVIVQPSWRQAQNSQAQQAEQLLKQGIQQTQQQQHQQAIQTLQQVLTLARELKDKKLEATVLVWLGLNSRKTGQLQEALKFYNQSLPLSRAVGDRAGEATTLNNIGRVYSALGQKQEALKFYNQSLPLRRAVGDRAGEATTLNNIGGVYSALGQKQEALKFYNQSLPLSRAVGDRAGEATTLNNIGGVYSDLGQKQEALKFYNQSLPLRRAVGDRAGEAITLGNIGLLYRDTDRPTDAISSLEQCLKIILEMRQGLERQNRQKFLQVNDWSKYLVDILIEQKQYAKAFEWVNLFTTAELADYTRLINAKVVNFKAQLRLDKWNQQNQELEALRQQLKDKFSEDLAQQIRRLEEQVYKDGEDISQRFPEVAELFETTPADIEKLKASIPAGVVVVQPVLLNNSIAIFVLAKDHLNVVKKPIDATTFNSLLTDYRQQVKNDGNSDYVATGSSPLYDYLIRPVENEIQALSPKQLSIITSGKLRYLPFETFYDKKKQEFLINKYPVNYLTRISTRSLEPLTPQKLVDGQAVLAFGNPVPREPQNLPGAEEEVNQIARLFPTSLAYLHEKATLGNFKTYASRFPLLHLATHGCFQNQDCKKLNLKKNTLLFADTQFDIADAARLGLQGTQLLTLSACQTAQETSSYQEGIIGVAYVFERAGAQAVMASLWAVEDKATKELMIEFYQNIKQGMSKAEALQKAKLKQIDRHPYYWSPFILIGDVR